MSPAESAAEKVAIPHAVGGKVPSMPKVLDRVGRREGAGGRWPGRSVPMDRLRRGVGPAEGVGQLGPSGQKPGCSAVEDSTGRSGRCSGCAYPFKNQKSL